MSVAAPTRKSSKRSESPEVITQTAVPITQEEETQQPSKMQRLNSIPINPVDLPLGMKSVSKRIEDEARQQLEAAQAAVEREEKNKKTLKLIALGGAVAVGAILAYKASSYLTVKDIEQIVDETTNNEQ